MSLKRRHSRERPGARLLSTHEMMLVNFPPRARFEAEVRREWRSWVSSSEKQQVWKLYSAGQPVPLSLLPAYFSAQPEKRAP